MNTITLNTATPNNITVNLEHITITFSYNTPVAFVANGKTTVRENIWGTTTGKHLNRVDGGTKQAKAERVNTETFEHALSNALAGRVAIGDVWPVTLNA